VLHWRICKEIKYSKCKGKGKIVPVLNEVPRHEVILCLTKHHALKTYGGTDL